MEKINIFKRKRLNNKGFTLIELLAVVVILAIVMGIAATSVLNSINNSRRSSLYSAAQNAANQLNTWAAEDALVQDDGARKLGSTFETTMTSTYKNKWVCIGALKIVNASVTAAANGVATPGTQLLTALGISNSDVLIGGTSYNNSNAGATADMPILAVGGTPTNTTKNKGTCSAVRYNTSANAYEVMLNANQGGKYYVTNDPTHYAFSRATKENEAVTN